MEPGPVDFAHPAVRAALQRDLLAWFDASARDLAWRRRRSLYGTWISEMMLQQTTVATVVPYWERFLARFPDVAALAAAPEDDVLAHWSGLGYYRRARHLHAAARQVVDTLGGRLPEDVEGWRRLPGIGPYAAGAIASLGLGLPEPAVDANVRRVLARWLGTAGTGGDAPAAEVARLARALVPADRPGAWNEALMELGALVCPARQPLCASCPVAPHCRTGKTGAVAMASSPAPGRAAVPVAVLLAVIRSGSRVWLEVPGQRLLPCRVPAEVAREELSGLHQGLLTLPTTAWYLRPAKGTLDLLGALEEAWVDAWADGSSMAATLPPKPLGRFRHAITRYRLDVTVAVLDAAPGLVAPPGRDGRWVDLDDASAGNISQLARKALRLIAHGQG